MPTDEKERQHDVNPDAPAALIRRPRDLVITTIWFGLVAGWAELGLVLTQRSLNPHISMDMLRTNRHFVWMVPVSNVVIFTAIGFTLGVLARWRPKLASVFFLRLPIALFFLALFLNIEGMYAVASLVLACGLASFSVSLFGHLLAESRRTIQISLLPLALALLVLIGVVYQRVTSAERRTLDLLPTAAPGIPNILLIVLDNVRAASLSLYGHDRPTSPNLERLARQGLLFTEARAPAPWTLPSHASMLTGRWPHELSVGWDLPLDTTFPTLAETLAGEGYATAGFVGNSYYCNALYGLGRGFARYEDSYENRTVSLFETVRSSSLGKRILQALGYSIRVTEGGTTVRKTAAMLNRDVLSWLAQRPADQPFFAFLNYFDAHEPWLPPEGPDPKFGMGALSNPERIKVLKRYQALRNGKSSPAEGTRERIERDAVAVYRDSYESCIAYLDRQVGLLYAELERRGLLENTMVIVTSDHGEHFREHGFFGHGLSLFRHEVQVPFLLIPPRHASSPKIINEPVSLREIPATVAEWVGLGGRSPFPGRSLTRFSTDGIPPPGEKSPVLCEVQHQEKLSRMNSVPASLGPVHSLVSEDGVYILNAGGREELYSLSSDLLESHNLAGSADSRPVLDHFREELGRIFQNADPPATASRSAVSAGGRLVR